MFPKDFVMLALECLPGKLIKLKTQKQLNNLNLPNLFPHPPLIRCSSDAAHLTHTRVTRTHAYVEVVGRTAALPL